MLKLVLQTQEGQQIEVTVSQDDTFADLQRQYESPENPGLPELLRHLITNGTDVDQKTKVFDYVTNSSSTEWLVEESLDNINALESVDPSLQTIVEEGLTKECCVEDCPNTEITAPEKVLFPLPTDKDRLSSWLLSIGKAELFNIYVESEGEISGKRFVCSDHFAPHHFLKGTNQALKRRACPSLTPNSLTEKTNSLPNRRDSMHGKTGGAAEQRISEFGKEEDPDDPDTMDSGMLELFNVYKDTNHPGVLCRLCGEQTVDPVYLFLSENLEGECSVADKINLCLPITVNAKDPLPKQVCASCLDKLNTCHQLAKTCLETEDKLKSMFESKKFRVKDGDDKQCPLCVSGWMKNVTKSGIYRRDKAESVPEFMENSSARTRQVSPSKNLYVNVKLERSSSVNKEPLQELDDVISTSAAVESFKNVDVSMDEPRDELSCSVCRQTEDSIQSLTRHAKKHDGYPCTICRNVNFETINEQKLHFLWHGVNDGFCDICSVELANAKEAAEHIRLCKPEFWNVECARCGEKFPHVEAGQDHICPVSEREEEEEEEEEEENWFKCDKCGKKFSAKTDLNAHLKGHEKRETVFYNCSFCNKQFTRKGSLQKHISTVHTGTIESTSIPKCFKCRKCDEAFASGADAEAHITEKHFSQFIMSDMNIVSDQFTAEEISLSRVYICEYCERCYTIPGSLHEHRQNEHSENSDYQCNICSSTFKAHKSLLRHKTLHVRYNELEDLGIKQYYLCNYCNKTFLHYGTLTVHSSQHQQPLPYLCKLCNLNFATYKEIAEHRKTTHPYQSVFHERPNSLFHCQYCEKSFTHEVALIKHIRMHTGERPYKCSICGKGFSQTSGLYTHLKVHSDLRPYTCPQCPQTFKIKGDRDNHVKKHSGDRPYKCEFCEKAFMTQHVYSQHRKIHTNERPYKCEVCGEAFRRSHVLTVHMRRHTGEKPHMCDLCPKAYRQRGDLLKHKKIQHGVGANNSISPVGTNSLAELVTSADIPSSESGAVFSSI